MDFVGVRKDLKFTFFQSSNKDQIKILVRKLAEYVKNYAGPILNGDLAILEKVQILQKEKSDAYIKEMDLRHIRERADIAWKQKDYVKFLEIYSSVEYDLTLVEAKKSNTLEKSSVPTEPRAPFCGT